MGINTFNTQLPTALGYAVNNMNEALKDRKSFLGSIANTVVTDTNAFLKNIGNYNTVEAKRYLDSLDPSVITNLRNQGVAEQDIYTRLLGNKGYGNGVQMNDHDANLMNSFGNLNKAEGQKRDIDVANYIDQNANDASILGLSAKDIAERAGYRNLNSTALANVDVLRNSGREDFLKRLQSDYNASGLNSTDYFNRNEKLKEFNPLQKDYDTLDSGKKTYLKSVIDSDIRDEVNRRANATGRTPAQVRTSAEYQNVVNQAIQKNNAGNLFNNGDFTNFDVNNPLTQQVNQDNKTQRRDTALDNVRNYMNNIFSKNADIDYDSGMAEINAMLSNAGITGQERTNIENEFKDKIADNESTKALINRLGTIYNEIQAGNLQGVSEEQALELMQAYNDALINTKAKKGNIDYINNKFSQMLAINKTHLQEITQKSKAASSVKIANYQKAILNNVPDPTTRGVLTDVFNSLESNKLEPQNKEEGEILSKTLSVLKDTNADDEAGNYSKFISIVENPNDPLSKIYSRALIKAVGNTKVNDIKKRINKLPVYEVMSVLTNKENNNSLMEILKNKTPNTLTTYQLGK